MIDFELTREQREIQRLAHEFAEKEIRPKAAYYDETEEFPWEIVKKAHKIGLTTFSYPEEYGGGGIDDPVTSLLVSEELAWGCAGIADAISGSHLPAAAIRRWEQPGKRKNGCRFFVIRTIARSGLWGLQNRERGRMFLPSKRLRAGKAIIMY